ncbi:30S ribosomal protein S16 [Candidatus Microgenomates bacterium]|nr:30S ribosomal protein S16 [Candidatus Microgenomates bacterium]
MLMIRLSRVGRKKQAMFRVVVADKRRTPTGRFVAQIGHYDPHAKEFVVDEERLQAYLKDGAQPSSTMVKLLKRAKIKLPAWAEANLIVKNKAPKAKKGGAEAAEIASPEKADAPKVEAPAESTTEPTVESKAEEPPAEAGASEPEKPDATPAAPAEDAA